MLLSAEHETKRWSRTISQKHALFPLLTAPQTPHTPFPLLTPPSVLPLPTASSSSSSPSSQLSLFCLFFSVFCFVYVFRTGSPQRELILRPRHCWLESPNFHFTATETSVLKLNTDVRTVTFTSASFWSRVRPSGWRTSVQAESQNPKQTSSGWTFKRILSSETGHTPNQQEEEM